MEKDETEKLRSLLEGLEFENIDKLMNDSKVTPQLLRAMGEEIATAAKLGMKVNVRARLCNKTMNDYIDPRWEEAGRVQDWRNHVPEHIKCKWEEMSDSLKHDLYLWAEELASAEEWD